MNANYFKNIFQIRTRSLGAFLPQKPKIFMKLRSRKFPKCSTPDELDDLLVNHPEVKNIFGKFKGTQFYRGKVTSGSQSALIFMLSEVLEVLPYRLIMSTDGTFSIVPGYFKRLYLLFADIAGKVC